MLNTLRDHQKTLDRVKQLEMELAGAHQELNRIRSYASQTDVATSPAGEGDYKNEEAV